MFEMSNVLPQHNLHFARPGSSPVLTHDMYFSICSQAWLNLHCKKTAIVFTGKNWQLSCQNNPVKNTSTCKPLYRAACKFNILNLYIQHWISAIFTSLLCYTVKKNPVVFTGKNWQLWLPEQSCKKYIQNQ